MGHWDYGALRDWSIADINIPDWPDLNFERDII